jgi:hypothetical protein
MCCHTNHAEKQRDTERTHLRGARVARHAAELNWFSANLRVAAALAERGYDLRLVLGDGGHDPNHGGAILPDALRWLWRRESE